MQAILIARPSATKSRTKMQSKIDPVTKYRRSTNDFHLMILHDLQVLLIRMGKPTESSSPNALPCTFLCSVVEDLALSLRSINSSLCLLDSGLRIAMLRQHYTAAFHMRTVWIAMC